MRARIIFRGLTLFRFPKYNGGSIERAKPGEGLGPLEAWLVSSNDPRMSGMPLHTHTPRLGYMGSDASRRPVARAPEKFSGDLAIGLTPSSDQGVSVDSSFLEYVPRLGALYGQNVFEQRSDGFKITKITIPSGTIRAGNFISWDWHGNTPGKVGYMNSNFQGFGANEVVVDIGDDNDFEKADPAGRLVIRGLPDGEVTLSPYYRRGQPQGDALENIEVNTAEAVVTNLTARRRRPVPWGLHYQWLFDVAGFDRRPFDPGQWDELVAAATQYDRFEWESDFGHMNDGKPVGQPFPYLINPRGDVLPKIDPADPRDQIQPAPSLDFLRRSGDAEDISMTRPAMSSMRDMRESHDPVNTQLCPFGFI